MAWGLFAAAAATVIGTVSGRKNAKDARKSEKESLALQQEVIDFAQQQYDDWKDIYGPVEQNLADFYEGLDEEFFTTRGLQNVTEQYNTERTQLDETFAQLDVTTGAEAAIRTSLNLQEARDKAGVVSDAPLQVADAQQNFLSLGASAKQAAANGITNANNNMSNTLSDIAGQRREDSRAGYAAAASGIRSGINLLETRHQNQTANSGATEVE